ARAAQYVVHAVVAQGSGVNNGVEVLQPTEGFEMTCELVVGRERFDPRRAHWAIERAPVAFEAKHFVAGLGKEVRPRHAEFAGGEVGHAPGLVDWFVAWTAGDDDLHLLIHM